MNYNPSVVILNLSKAKIKHYKLKILYAGFFNHLLLRLRWRRCFCRYLRILPYTSQTNNTPNTENISSTMPVLRLSPFTRALVGYDLLQKNVEHLKNGEVNYLIGQRPGLQGYCGIKALCNHVVFKKPVTAVKYMPIDILMKENIDFYFEFE